MQRRTNHFRVTRRLLPVFISVLFFWMLQGACGSPGSTSPASSDSGTGSTESGVTITGTVEAPVSTTTSVSIGQSLSTPSVSASKSVSKGSSVAENSPRVIVSKAVSDVLVSSGTVTAKTPSGTTLKTATISSAGAITGLVIPPANLDSTNQVILDCDVGGKKFSTIVDASGKAVGATVSAGTVNTDSTLNTQCRSSVNMSG